MSTLKKFRVPDEVHPNRRKTMQAIYVCEHCEYTGDFMFCPYCGKKRLCPSAAPTEGGTHGSQKEPDAGDPEKLG